MAGEKRACRVAEAVGRSLGINDALGEDDAGRLAAATRTMRVERDIARLDLALANGEIKKLNERIDWLRRQLERAGSGDVD